MPKTNAAFWREKFDANRARDERALRRLREAGYRVAVIWECEADEADLVSTKLSEVLEPRRVDMS